MRIPILTAIFLTIGSYSNASVFTTCGGLNDTSSLQSAITTAQAMGDEVILPSSPCKTTAPLIITDRVTISGVGYADDAGSVYTAFSTTGAWGSFYPIPATLKGSVILPGAHDTFRISTNAAVKLTGFQISYNQSSVSGSAITAVKIGPSAGAGAFNTRSVLRDITITNADRGIEFTDAMEFRLDNVNVMYFWERGVITQGTHGPSWGDSVISNSTLWGMDVSSGVCHVCIYSGGGLRIVGSKLNVGNGIGGSGVLIYPNLSQQQTVEPLIISGTSIEGQAVGVNFANANLSGATISEVSIQGGNIWSGVNAIRINGSGSSHWVGGLTVAGVNLMVVGGTGKTVVALDNIDTAVLTGNTFSLSGGGTGWGTNLGINSTRVNIQSNGYSPGMTPVINSGTGNTIGGGSM